MIPDKGATVKRQPSERPSQFQREAAEANGEDLGLLRFIQPGETVREAVEKALLLHYQTFRRRARLALVPEPEPGQADDLGDSLGDVTVCRVDCATMTITVWVGQPETILVGGPPQTHDKLPAWLKDLPEPPKELVDQIRRSVEEHRKERSYDGRALPRDLREG